MGKFVGSHHRLHDIGSTNLAKHCAIGKIGGVTVRNATLPSKAGPIGMNEKTNMPQDADGIQSGLETEVSNDDPVLGERIRGLRKRRKLTLAQLAQACDLSTGYISQIERNLAFPSIPALVNIAKSLGVTVQWFFAGASPVPQDEHGYVIRRGNRLKIQYDRGIVDELVTPKMSLQVEMIYTRLPAGTESAQSYSHNGDGVGFVMSGELEIWVGERHFHLYEGDSCSYSSGEPHRYKNPGADEAIIMWAISPPNF
jgi:transcriptional regulator with XRE-family HTH domain